jgi:hypothetical protein
MNPHVGGHPISAVPVPNAGNLGAIPRISSRDPLVPVFAKDRFATFAEPIDLRSAPVVVSLLRAFPVLTLPD